MASRLVTTFQKTSTADGDTTGYLTVADNSGFWTGAIVTLTGASGSPVGREAVITETPGTTQVGLKFLTDTSGRKRSDLTGFTTGSTLTQESQATAGVRN